MGNIGYTGRILSERLDNKTIKMEAYNKLIFQFLHAHWRFK